MNGGEEGNCPVSGGGGSRGVVRGGDEGGCRRSPDSDSRSPVKRSNGANGFRDEVRSGRVGVNVW